MLLDELGVDGRDVDLPQVDAGRGVGLDPLDHREQAEPNLCVGKHFQRVIGDPGGEPRAQFPGQLGQLGEASHLGPDAEQPPQRIAVVDPQPGGQVVRADQPAAHAGPLQLDAGDGHAPPAAEPLLDGAELAGELRRGRRP
jgi:hypothetical protein